MNYQQQSYLQMQITGLGDYVLCSASHNLQAKCLMSDLQIATGKVCPWFLLWNKASQNELCQTEWVG